MSCSRATSANRSTTEALPEELGEGLRALGHRANRRGLPRDRFVRPVDDPTGCPMKLASDHRGHRGVNCHGRDRGREDPHQLLDPAGYQGAASPGLRSTTTVRSWSTGRTARRRFSRGRLWTPFSLLLARTGRWLNHSHVQGACVRTGGRLICDYGSNLASSHSLKATHVRLQTEAFGPCRLGQPIRLG